MKILCFVAAVFAGILLFNVRAAAQQKKAAALTDGAETSKTVNCPPSARSYPDQLAQWKTAEEVAQWMGCNFSYDLSRAKALAANSENRDKTPILTPDQLYTARKGTCVDLARFTFETLKHIDTLSRPEYVMVDFEPVIIDGKALTKHWLVMLKKDNELWFMGDSKRPDAIVGPYADITAFRTAYEQYRNRKINSMVTLPSYQKRMKKKNLATKQDQ